MSHRCGNNGTDLARNPQFKIRDYMRDHAFMSFYDHLEKTAV
ncbi:hypothetical protein MESS4_830182 [Mesorhizobium sp. STM 4661]|nr:hypothetical protein MESS4_830182 [Mesorhizobium sp. STM 4661]